MWPLQFGLHKNVKEMVTYLNSTYHPSKKVSANDNLKEGEREKEVKGISSMRGAREIVMDKEKKSMCAGGHLTAAWS